MSMVRKREVATAESGLEKLPTVIVAGWFPTDEFATFRHELERATIGIREHKNIRESGKISSTRCKLPDNLE